ncbi:MAG: hypothetical protein HQK57_15915 [Deltaproteobacteria bacterium]|nr:hypothetical protein [Deltaproteobacteria bacterium]
MRGAKKTWSPDAGDRITCCGAAILVLAGLTRLTGFMGHDNPGNLANPVRKRDGGNSKLDLPGYYFLTLEATSDKDKLG